MGEKIGNLGKLHLKGVDYDIEINKSSARAGNFEIHIQSHDFRLEMTEDEFLKLGVAVRVAYNNLRIQKNL